MTHATPAVSRVWVGNNVSEWFPVNVGLRQSCVMSPWLFNVYMDRVVRKVNVRVHAWESDGDT